MPLYLYQGAYTPAALAAQMKNPQNRVEAVARASSEAVGGKLIGCWYSFGDHDFSIVVDLPDKESMAAIALAVGAGGALKTAKTTALLSGTEFIAAMTKAQAVAKVYKPPS
ncbi:GYD domain-containing protein [Falsiroseomonas sp. E2-1-a4]|uniref:GYD domain-containing protein n=1 Tax=Falsiroseomonas sp. E2-1-a4 TaxID=3239299 RepID=UPI003F2FBF13